MKRKLIFLGLSLLIFILFSVCTFALIYSFLNIFVNFGKLALSSCLWISLGISMSFSVLLYCYSFICFKSTKGTRFRHWLSQKYPKIILFYGILLMIFVSIKAEIIWSFDSLKDIISLEWTIFGISITVFLVWNVVILKYLEKSKPIKPDTTCSVKLYEYISQKESFYPQASTMFNTITLVILNLFILVLATGFSFVIKEEVTLFKQNFTIVSLYLSGNTLISLLLDILHPLKEEKKAMLEDVKITYKEITEKNDIEEKILNAQRLLNDIEKLECVDEELKEKMKAEIALKALGIEYILDRTKNHNSSE